MHIPAKGRRSQRPSDIRPQPQPLKGTLSKSWLGRRGPAISSAAKANPQPLLRKDAGLKLLPQAQQLERVKLLSPSAEKGDGGAGWVTPNLPASHYPVGPTGGHTGPGQGSLTTVQKVSPMPGSGPRCRRGEENKSYSC